MSERISPRTLRAATATASLVFVACGGAESQCPPVAAPAPVASASAPPPPAAVVAAPAVKEAAPAAAPLTDEGMWLTNDFPKERVAQLYNFTPTDEWLEHVRLSSVRLAGGCSGSFVSANGLVMTNHHCAHSCIDQLSTAKKDYVKEGFLAKTDKDEVKCPEIEVNQLTNIEDVSAKVQGATVGLTDKAFNEAQRGVIAKLEKECATGDDVRCDVVNLYHGGRYHLYKYRRYQDVRLVFAPEFGIAFFGGDPDNFNFPRFNLDVSFLRVYDHGKPLAAKDFLKWNDSGLKEGDLTFISGHPGGTSRQLTMSQLEYQRDYALPRRLFGLNSFEGALSEFMKRGPEQKRIAETDLFRIQNGLKAIDGRRESLVDHDFWASKERDEKALRAEVEKSPELKQYSGAWDAIAKVQGEKADIAQRYGLLEGGNAIRPYSSGFGSSLFDAARMLVRMADESGKPNDQRLKEYADARMPAIKQQLSSVAPIYKDLEALKLGRTFIELRQTLGADDPVVKKVLGKDEANELAQKLVTGSKLSDVKFRMSLFTGGAAAIKASKDPMLELARLVDSDAREVRTRYEEHIDSVEKKFGEQIAKAKFGVYGTHVYPDATFSLRLSFGHVAGWMEAGKPVAPFTTFGGAFERATGKDPFELPKSWLAAKGQLDLNTPFDVVTTNDIIGGNSGSPVVNKNGEAVGLVFDGNIHSLGGEFGYEPKNNRAVSVTAVALSQALDKVYGAKRIIAELHGK